MVEPPCVQIFSLDVTALSDRLDISADELFAGLHGHAQPTTPHAHIHAPPIQHGVSNSPLTSKRLLPSSIVSIPNAPVAYAVCLVVSQWRAVYSTNTETASVLELSLRRLVLHPPCMRVAVCVTDDTLFAEVDSIVRACKRLSLLTNASIAIEILHGDQYADDVSAVRYASTHLAATVSASSITSKPLPLVVIQVDARVFDNATIGELVHQQQNAAILTDGLTRAVVLVDKGKDTMAQSPVGIWVCSLPALVAQCEATAKQTIKLNRMAEPEDDGDLTSLDAWLPSVLGPLHCETVIASAEFNWEEQRSGSDAFVFRFEPSIGDTDGSNQTTEEDEEGRESGLLDWTKTRSRSLAAIQAELDSDGIIASLIPIPTSVVHHTWEAPSSSVDMAIAPPKTPATIDEHSPLLSNGSRATTMTTMTGLSEIDLEDAGHPEASDTAAHAYLIQVDQPSSSRSLSDPATPELIFAFPDEHPSHPSSNELDAMPPLVHIRKRTDDLPTSVTHITLEAVVLDKAAQQLGGLPKRRLSVILHVEKQVPVVGYLILITALCAVSSQGAVLDLLVGVPPLLKLFWRVSGVSLTLCPFAVVSMYHKGLPALSTKKRWLALGCVLAYTTYNATFLIALSLTSIGHVYIFSNSHSLILVVSKLLTGQPLAALELIGAALGFSGGVVTTLDHPVAVAGDPPAGGKTPSTLGDLVAFTGAFAGVAYLLSAKKLRAALGVRVFLFLLTTGVALLLLPILILNSTRLGIRLDDLTHPTNGLMGWVHHLDIEVCLVLVGSICGTMGFLASLKYFDPLVVSVTMLTEPVVATIISIGVGVERVPGWLTFIGGFAVIIGCLLVLLATHKTSQKIDVSDRLVKTPFTSASSVLREPDNLLDRRSMASISSSCSPSSALASMPVARRRGTYGSLAQ